MYISVLHTCVFNARKYTLKLHLNSVFALDFTFISVTPIPHFYWNHLVSFNSNLKSTFSSCFTFLITWGFHIKTYQPWGLITNQSHVHKHMAGITFWPAAICHTKEVWDPFRCHPDVSNGLSLATSIKTVWLCHWVQLV